MIRYTVLLTTLLFSASFGLAQATETTPEASPDAQQAPVSGMTLPQLWDIVRSVDAGAKISPTQAQLTLQDVPILVVTDPIADRMRAMVPIASAAGLMPEDLMRMMQANFDTALDARYAVARGRLWGVFIHPLSPLTREQFLSGLIQTVNIARTYGAAYSGGAIQFGGGDTSNIYRQLLDDLLKKGEEL